MLTSCNQSLHKTSCEYLSSRGSRQHQHHHHSRHHCMYNNYVLLCIVELEVLFNFNLSCCLTEDHNLHLNPCLSHTALKWVLAICHIHMAHIMEDSCFHTLTRPGHVDCHQKRLTQNQNYSLMGNSCQAHQPNCLH